MARQFLLMGFYVTLIASICLVFVKQSNELKTIFQKLMSTTTWTHVEILDKRSAFDELRDYSWEHLEVLAVGWTVCVVCFTIGWCVNCIHKAYTGDGDVVVECLEEHCVLLRRMNELEGRVTELEPRDHRVFSEKVSKTDFGGGECSRTKDELKLSESKTMIKACQSSYNCAMIDHVEFVTTCFSDIEPVRSFRDLPTYEEILEEDAKPLKRATLESETGKEAIFKEDIKFQSIYKPVNEQMFKESRETDKKMGQSKLVNGNETVVQSQDESGEHTHVVSDLYTSKPISSIDKISMEVIVVNNNSHGCRSQNEKSNVDGGLVSETVQTNLNVTTMSTKITTLETSENEPVGSYVSLGIPSNQGCPGSTCWYTETESYLEENCRNKSEVDGNRNVCEDDLEIALNNSKNFSSKTDGDRTEADKFSKLDVSQTTMTVIDVVSSEPDSTRSADWRDSSTRTNTRGRIVPQYHKLHKDTNTDLKTRTFNEKSSKNMTLPTGPHMYIDELPTNVSSSPIQKNSPQRQSRPNTPTGETLHSTGGQRKKKPNRYSQNSSYKTDATHS